MHNSSGHLDSRQEKDMNNKDEQHREEKAESPSHSQQTVSDDDEIDYSVKPEFYDSELDDKDELWVQKKRGVRTSDAILNCPACFTTLCLDCQRIHLRIWLALGSKLVKVDNDKSLCFIEMDTTECLRSGKRE